MANYKLTFSSWKISGTLISYMSESSSASLLHSLAAPEVQQYLQGHEHDDEQKLILKHKSLFGIPTAALAEQLRGRRKAKDKLPSYYATTGIVYPPSVNLEQSSSEASANFKAEVIQRFLPECKSCADLTSGFGVDSYFFSKAFDHVDYVEPNQTLLEITRHSHEKLKAKNISYQAITAEGFLQQTNKRFDLLYLDPSRRDKANKKVFRFSSCEPDVTALTSVLFAKADFILIKASPLIDLQQGLQELQNVRAIFILSVKNECKEVLFLCQSFWSGEPTIHAVNLQDNDKEEFSFARTEEKAAVAEFSEPLTYLYEPNTSILKAGAFKLVSVKFRLNKLHANTHLYTSNEFVKDFPGRVYKVKAVVKPVPAAIKAFFITGKANVVTRNYPLAAETLKKKMKLTDGGDHYLIGFTAREKKYTVVADRLK